MDANSRDILRVIDKMTAAGWIKRSASNQQGGVIEWTDDGKKIMTLLHQLMFKSLRLQPGDESVFAWMVSDFPEGQRRVSRRQRRRQKWTPKFGQ
jgi:CTP-dependent riboflavin kinase